MSKKNLIIASVIIVISIIGFCYCFFINISNEKLIVSMKSWEYCQGIKTIYDYGYYWWAIQTCHTSLWKPYLMTTLYGIEWWHGNVFFDTGWNFIGEKSKYWAGDWTMPKDFYITGTILTGTCIMNNLQQCWIIDLVSSYRWTWWLLKDSEYAKTCKNTLEKLWLDPRYQSTDLDSSRRDLSHRYFMCTDDTDIFYIGFTGSKIWDSISASYQNFNTIEYFNFEGISLWSTTGFQLKTDGDQLHGITISDEKAPYTIERCIYIPTYDCYEE